MKEIKTMSDQELKEEYKQLFGQIYTFDCFGMKDMIRYEQICNELERRGYEYTDDDTLCKKEEDIWFEVFDTNIDGEEGTQTIQSFNTEEEAIEFKTNLEKINPDKKYNIDKWYMSEAGIPETF